MEEDQKDGKAEEGSKKREKRKKEEKEKERKKVEKRRRRKGMEGVCAGGKGRRRKERERERERKESSAKGALPSADAFPSTKLGNNMTPMKGRLGKNTTPTSNNPVKLNQNLQTNSQQK